MTPRIHFRYHDAVHALVGRHCYHYEVLLDYREVPEAVKSLANRGFDEFSIRELNSRVDPYNPWQSVEVPTLQS